ncbi:DUF5615 family PIN-like protein [Pararhizobium sp. LjRoot238]|uniref:DUF5615 family PIN-like protein n=1 Tax=Pararhizobium sp. LjRoot238 TaxID=3342293 RepID=UPI003ED08F7B
MRLLIDECLSPRLATMSQTAGYGESSHVVWLGKSGWKDWELKPLILDGDWTFVTKNSVDFRGSAANPGSKGQYADVALHAGLICLNGPDTMELAMQVELFDEALIELSMNSDLVNQVLEINMTDQDEIHVLRYLLPAE